jgi:hypothetical protein
LTTFALQGSGRRPQRCCLALRHGEAALADPTRPWPTPPGHDKALLSIPLLPWPIPVDLSIASEPMTGCRALRRLGLPRFDTPLQRSPSLGCHGSERGAPVVHRTTLLGCQTKARLPRRYTSRHCCHVLHCESFLAARCLSSAASAIRVRVKAFTPWQGCHATSRYPSRSHHGRRCPGCHCNPRPFVTIATTADRSPAAMAPQHTPSQGSAASHYAVAKLPLSPLPTAPRQAAAVRYDPRLPAHGSPLPSNQAGDSRAFARHCCLCSATLVEALEA